MKIAVSSTGNELTSAIDPRFGRAAYFIIFNTDDNSYEAVSNAENAGAAQGAGVQAAQTVANKKPDWVVSGNIGPKAFSALKAAGVKMASFDSGTVMQAVKLVMEGGLTEIGGANVQGHWKQ